MNPATIILHQDVVLGLGGPGFPVVGRGSSENLSHITFDLELLSKLALLRLSESAESPQIQKYGPENDKPIGRYD